MKGQSCESVSDLNISENTNIDDGSSNKNDQEKNARKQERMVEIIIKERVFSIVIDLSYPILWLSQLYQSTL